MNGQLREILGSEIRNTAGEGCVSARLFGSEAAGRAHRESDVDIGILVDRQAFPTPRSRFDLQILLSSRLSARLNGRPVDVVIMNDAPPLLGRRIVYEGERILCRDESADRDFVRDVQLQAADLEPFLRRMRRIKLESLRRP